MTFRCCLTLLAVLLGGLTQPGCGGSANPSEGGASESRSTPEGGLNTNKMTRVKLMLNWYPEAEHGGYYAALVNGYYQEAGLEVTIIPGGPNAPVVPQTARGAVEFGVTNADNVIMARAEGAKIKGVMAPLQTSPRCLLVHAESGIEKFEDIRNATLMMRRENAWAQFLVSKLALENVDIAPNSAGLAPFLNDKSAVKQGYIISEPFVAKEKGADVRSLLVAELGYNPYTSVLTTSDSFADANPEIVRAMVKASIRGWEAYLEDPESANKEIHKQNPEMGPEILAFGVTAIKQHCLGETTAPIGRMTSQRWTALVEQLEALKLVEPDSSPANEAFSTEFTSQSVPGAK